MGDILAHLNTEGIGIAQLNVSSEGLVGLLRMIDNGAVSGKMAKDVFAEAARTKASPEEVVKRRGLSQISNIGKLEEVVRLTLLKNEKSFNDYRCGKKNALGYLVGQIMKEKKSAANPAIVNEILKKILGD